MKKDKIMRVMCERLMGLMALPMTEQLEFRPLPVLGAYVTSTSRDEHRADGLGTTHPCCECVCLNGRCEYVLNGG